MSMPCLLYTSCRDLLADLIDRGLNYDNGLLAVIDGSKALRKALKTVFGHHVLVQRCQVHKMRNILDYLPNYKRIWVKKRLQQAWSAETFEEAKNKLHLSLIHILRCCLSGWLRP